MLDPLALGLTLDLGRKIVDIGFCSVCSDRVCALFC